MPTPLRHTLPLVGMLLVTTAPAAAQQARLRADWNNYAPEYRGQIGRRVTVLCPPGGKPSAVYGTRVYSDNSSICGAAMHAGVIDAAGGAVTLVVAPGESSYQGSTQNGVTSLSSGALPGSFTVERNNGDGRVDWTTTAIGIALSSTPLTLICPPRGAARGVWGTDIYTEDSSICTAAVHAGLLDTRVGGPVTIESTGPQQQFSASDRNGVRSQDWKAWPASFRVLSSASASAPQPQPSAPSPATAGVTVSPTTGLVTTEGGGTATFSVKLNAAPSVDVVIPLTSSSTAEGTVSPTSLTFTPANWMTAQTVTVRGTDDAVADGAQGYVIRTLPIQAAGDAAYNGVDAVDVSVTNTDDDAAAVAIRPISGISTTEAGGTASFVIALRSRPTGIVTINLSSSNPSEGTVSPASVSFDATNWSSQQAVTIRGVDDTARDGDVAYSIITSAAVSNDPSYNGLAVDDVSVTNRDDDN